MPFILMKRSDVPAGTLQVLDLDPNTSLRNLTRTWFRTSSLFRALREAERRRVSVLLTTDHGSIHCHTPATVFAKRDATANLRYKFGEDLRAERADTRKELRSVRLHLREDIERLGFIVKFINIALIPLAVILVGIGIALIKSYRRRVTL